MKRVLATWVASVAMLACAGSALAAPAPTIQSSDQSGNCFTHGYFGGFDHNRCNPSPG